MSDDAMMQTKSWPRFIKTAAVFALAAGISCWWLARPLLKEVERAV